MCEPSCPLNAYCAAPNDCSCYAGYTLVDRVCVPPCKDQCGADSSCIAPDQCHCNRGFLEQDGKCDDDIGDVDCEVASPSYSQPPAYNSLTRKC
ncbi:unnamed protein product [Ceratitis capitata]|uniref:(Mediterranean fruit fly) hypothetical protein n=1 Tax=Ceratitis capitata TaxID=7213 RepID=A0A811U3N5_CERCA|nr:unnamed protein product [Ceratitis capitata]